MYRSLILIFILSVLSACNLGAQPTANTAPIIEFAANIGSASYREGAYINIQVSITNTTGRINTVQFAIDNEMIEQVANPNPSNATQFVSTAQWQASGTGTRTLRVVASRSDGVYGEAFATITIVDANSPTNQPATTATNSPRPQTSNTPAPIVPTNAPIIPTNPPVQPSAVVPIVPPTNIPIGGAPQAVFLEMQNVRLGPSTDHTRLGSFNAGDRVTVLAVSLDGEWLKVPFSTYQGWVYAPILRVDGDLSRLPREAGAELPAEPITMPTATSIATSANLTVVNMDIFVPSDNSNQPKCGVPFTARVTIQNTTNLPTSTGLTLMQNVHVGSGTVNGSSGLALIPVNIDGNGAHTVEYTFTIDTFIGEEQRLDFIADANNEVIETNENDNRNSIGYILAQGNC